MFEADLGVGIENSSRNRTMSYQRLKISINNKLQTWSVCSYSALSSISLSKLYSLFFPFFSHFTSAN